MSSRRRFHGLVDVQDLAVRSDVERPARCHPHAAKHTIRGGGLLLGIGKNGIIRFDVFRELLVGLGVVNADGVVGDVELPDGFAALTERFAFGCSPASEGFGKPGEHDGALVFVIGELM